MTNQIKSRCTFYSLLLFIEIIFVSSYKIANESIIFIGIGDIFLLMCIFLPSPNDNNILSEINTVHNPFIFLEMTDIENNDECTICLSNDLDNEWVKLNCQHIFHRDCITEWLSINNTCPICREEAGEGETDV